MISSVHGSAGYVFLPVWPWELWVQNSFNAGGFKHREQPWRISWWVTVFSSLFFFSKDKHGCFKTPCVETIRCREFSRSNKQAKMPGRTMDAEKPSATTYKLSSIKQLSLSHWKLYSTNSVQMLGVVCLSRPRVSPSPTSQSHYTWFKGSSTIQVS